jgi:hypothetical protein
MQPRGHQEVACALRAGGRQDRGLELEEALVLHAPAQGVDDRAAPHDVLVERRAAQVQEAVFEADVLRVIVLARHGERQFGRGAEHLHVGDEHLDRTRREVGVFRARRALSHLSIDAHHPLGPHGLGEPEGGRVRVGHALRDSVVVAQIDEQDAAVVANAVAPAGEAHGRADIGGAQVAAGMSTITMHAAHHSRATGRVKASRWTA